MAAVHHEGATPDSGHYTATVTTAQMAYRCDDLIVDAKQELLANAWSDAYLIFLRNSIASIFEPCGDPHPARDPRAAAADEFVSGQQDAGAPLADDANLIFSGETVATAAGSIEETADMDVDGDE